MRTCLFPIPIRGFVMWECLVVVISSSLDPEITKTFKSEVDSAHEVRAAQKLKTQDTAAAAAAAAGC